MCRTVDVIIVGQGLAGTTLAWRLIEAGLEVVVLDRAQEMTSSRIAAGMLTPITGKRFVQAPDWELNFQEATRFYRHVETMLQTSFFEECCMVRLFQSRAEKKLFETKVANFSDVLTRTAPDVSGITRAPQWGGFEMWGGRLRVPRYLNASRDEFTARGRYMQHEFTLEQCVMNEFGCTIPSLNLAARIIVFCQGFQAVPLPQFEAVRLNPCKGEILTVEIPEFVENRIISHGFWIARDEGFQYRVGATYDWNDLSPNPTSAGREWLSTRLGQLLEHEWHVVQQDAAIRPTMHDFQPVLGFHPQHPQLGMLNGLGSKGALWAPRLARLLVENLQSGTPLPPEMSLSRWYK